MSTRVLDFEKPIVELEGKIRELKLLLAGGNLAFGRDRSRSLPRAGRSPSRVPLLLPAADAAVVGHGDEAQDGKDKSS